MKTKYTEDFPALAEDFARQGMLDVDIARKLGVSVGTLNAYKNRYPEFCAALKRGKAPVDFEVENALLKRALGCTVKETRVETAKDESGNKLIKKYLIEREIPGEVAAQIFWLKNRRKDIWRQVISDNNSGLSIEDIKAVMATLAEVTKNHA